jgi:hypothetical protein
MKHLASVITAIVITAIVMIVALPTAAGASPTPLVDSWFASAIVGAAETAHPSAPQGTVEDCTPIVREIIVQCHVAWTGMPTVVRVVRLTYQSVDLAVVYDTRGWYVVRYRSCAMVGGINGRPFIQVCHY